jgi:hypothetical protein
VSTRPVRIRGRALQRARAALFARSPWCAGCEADGRQVRATIRDHLLPLAEGGTDDVENTQGLCLDCFEAKKEDEARRGVSHPGLRNAFRKASAPRGVDGHFSARRATRERNPDQPIRAKMARIPERPSRKALPPR